MAGYVIHLAVAEEYRKKHAGEISDYNEFINGVIYPDSVSDKSLTHYGPKSSKVHLKEFLINNSLESDYNKGYFVHLITDYLFYNHFLKIFSKDIYNDYDILNEYLIKKYKVHIPKEIQKSIFYKEGKLSILNQKDIVDFIDNVSSYDITNIKNEVLNNVSYWCTYIQLLK